MMAIGTFDVVQPVDSNQQFPTLELFLEGLDRWDVKEREAVP